MLSFIKNILNPKPAVQMYPATPEEYREIYREYNEQQLAKAKQELGEKWILHPKNRVKKRKLSREELKKITVRMW